MQRHFLIHQPNARDFIVTGIGLFSNWKRREIHYGSLTHSNNGCLIVYWKKCAEVELHCCVQLERNKQLQSALTDDRQRISATYRVFVVVVHACDQGRIILGPWLISVDWCYVGRGINAVLGVRAGGSEHRLLFLSSRSERRDRLVINSRARGTDHWEKEKRVTIIRVTSSPHHTSALCLSRFFSPIEQVTHVFAFETHARPFPFIYVWTENDAHVSTKVRTPRVRDSPLQQSSLVTNK